MGDPIQQRENLYKLIISQLRYDGLEAVAATLSKIINTTSPCPPSARLHQVVNLGIQAENDGIRPEPQVIPGLTAPIASTKGIDMEYEPEGSKNHSENGESSNTADEGFLSNLKLQKVTDNAGPSKLTSKQDQLSEEDVQKHIQLITSGRKTRPVPDEINVMMSEDSSTTLNTDICASVKKELQRFNISQEVFAKVVIGKTQGYLSEMLRQGEKVFNSPDKIFGKGQKNFETMREFLKLPEHERRQRYAAKCDELRLEKLKKRESEQGCSFESPKKKPRQQIPSDAKVVMERFYDAENKYLTAERRETLANQLHIPEQSVSDFFKNLRSRRKYEERMQGILASCGSDSGAEGEEEEEMERERPDNGACGSAVSPKKLLTPDSLDNKPQVAKSSPLNSELVSQDSSDDELGDSIYFKILALGKNQTSSSESQNNCEGSNRDTVPSPSRNSEHSHCASFQAQGPTCGATSGVFSEASFELVDRDRGFLTQGTKMEVFHPISGEELFVVQLEDNAVPSRVHLSHQL